MCVWGGKVNELSMRLQWRHDFHVDPLLPPSAGTKREGGEKSSLPFFVWRKEGRGEDWCQLFSCEGSQWPLLEVLLFHLYLSTTREGEREGRKAAGCQAGRRRERYSPTNADVGEQWKRKMAENRQKKLYKRIWCPSSSR